ncbi:MAG: hypothetical protein QG578_1851 [Thermodesulfobacteriota bacterium]|nr:hypothetical protein [Thermodesulfobacteriota bacterium]
MAPYAALFFFCGLFSRLRVEYIHLFKIIPKVFPFVRSEHSQRKTNECPKVHNRIMSAVMLTQFMYLRMAVVAAGNTVVGAGSFNLLIFQPSVFEALVLESRLEESAAPAATVIIRFVGLHINKVFFSNYRFHYKPEIFGYRIAIAFSDNLTGVLYRKFDFKILVPVGIDFELSFTYPFRIIFINVLYFKIMLKVEFFQSGPD